MKESLNVCFNVSHFKVVFSALITSDVSEALTAVWAVM